MQILHITDAHIDPEYTPGNNALCKDPCCCRKEQGQPNLKGGEAGYWGDYRDCDSPPYAFTNLVQQAAASHPDVTYVAYTGDSVPHAIWATSEAGNMEIISRVLRDLRDAFPGKLVLPVLGNHEPHPFNQFTAETERATIPSNLSSEWVYQQSKEEWSTWLADQGATIHKGGYYVVEVKPKLLVIGLNNNFCYNFNWWTMLDPVDPAGQLRWLAETLLSAEQRGQKVHILAHIPGNAPSCVRHWRREYQRVLRRFQDTIVAQFHGHEHTDYFSLYYDPDDDTQVTGVAFTAGSATAYTHVNPNYRVYTVEAEGEFRVLDHETWYFNLTEANIAGPDVPPNWQKLYSFNEAALAKGCDEICHRKLICDIVTYDPDNKTKCEALAEKHDTLKSPAEIYMADIYREEAEERKAALESNSAEGRKITDETVEEMSIPKPPEKILDDARPSEKTLDEIILAKPPEKTLDEMLIAKPAEDVELKSSKSVMIEGVNVEKNEATESSGTLETEINTDTSESTGLNVDVEVGKTADYNLKPENKLAELKSIKVVLNEKSEETGNPQTDSSAIKGGTEDNTEFEGGKAIAFGADIPKSHTKHPSWKSQVTGSMTKGEDGSTKGIGLSFDIESMKNSTDQADNHTAVGVTLESNTNGNGQVDTTDDNTDATKHFETTLESNTNGNKEVATKNGHTEVTKDVEMTLESNKNATEEVYSHTDGANEISANAELNHTMETHENGQIEGALEAGSELDVVAEGGIEGVNREEMTETFTGDSEFEPDAETISMEGTTISAKLMEIVNTPLDYSMKKGISIGTSLDAEKQKEIKESGKGEIQLSKSIGLNIGLGLGLTAKKPMWPWGFYV
ncbi:hypothetical protein B566_EDAN011904 [Ephemera danica]|nr:hypothetical protein B566_EDAN011904 [Ephemera danica]